jgi:hypothetical protein
MKLIENGYSLIDKIESHPNGTIKWSVSTVAAFTIYYIIPAIELFYIRSMYAVCAFTFISFIYYAKENSPLKAIKTLATNIIFIMLFVFVINPLLIIELLGEIYYLLRSRTMQLSLYTEKITSFLSIYITFMITLPVLLMVMADCIKLPISD